jgi:hypothetical protein
MRQPLFWFVFSLVAPANAVQLGCPGYTLGEDSPGTGVLTATFRNDEVLVSLEQPSGDVCTAPMPTVMYVLPEYLDLARQDMRLCQ